MKDLNQLLIEAQKLTNSISFTVEVVTPEIAIKYLNTSIGNRNIKKDTITALVNALTKGTFEVNGETIVFDQNGSLMDGHHRMEAIVRANIPAICLVIRGINRNTWTTMDSGTARSLGDVFKFEGIANYNSVSTIVAGTFAMIKNKVGINTLGAGNKLNREGLSRKDASLRNLFLKDMQETRFKKMSAQSRQSCIACAWNRYLIDKRAKRVQYNFTEIVMFN